MAVKELCLYDEIGYWGARAADVQRQIQALALTASDDLMVCLNSPGGEIYEGLGIYASIRHAPCAKRIVRVDGLAASMGSVIAMAGDEIEMGDGSLMMVHDPMAMVMGNAEEMREVAEVLDKHRDALCSIYTKRSGKSADEIKALMASETWMTGAEAVAAGFATRVGAAPASGVMQARFTDRGRYRLPAAAARYFTARASAAAPPPPRETPMDPIRLRRRAITMALLADALLLAAQDTGDAELQTAIGGAKERMTALRTATPNLVDQGSPLALLETLGTVGSLDAPTFADAQAHALVLSAQAKGAGATEDVIKDELLDAAIKAGKAIAPAHKAAWKGLPLAKLRTTLDGLPVANVLPTKERKASQNPHAEEAEAAAGDETYGGLHKGLGLKQQGGAK